MEVFKFKFHGYDVADQILEDVYFEVVVEVNEQPFKGTVTSVEPVSTAKDYWNKVGGPGLQQDIKDHAETLVQEVLESPEWRKILTELDDRGCLEY